MDTTIALPRIMEIVEDTRLRVKSAAFTTNTRDGIKACSDQAAKLRGMDDWTLRDPVRLAFYSVEANVNPNNQVNLLIELVGRALGTILEAQGVKEMAPAWQILGLVEGDPALAMLQAKECASSLVQEALKQQEEIDRLSQELQELREAQANPQHAAVSRLQQESQQQAAKMESISAANLLLQADNKAKQEELAALKAEMAKTAAKQQSENAKLRTELQTALAAVTELKAAAQRPETPTVIKSAVQAIAPPVDNVELERLRKQVAEQSTKLERYQSSVAAKFDADVRRVVDLIEERVDTSKDTPLMLGIGYLKDLCAGR